MAITLTGNGFNYTFPVTFGLVGMSQDNRLGEGRIHGRRGQVIRPFTAAEDAQEVRVEGLIAGTSAADTRSQFDTLAEVLSSGALLLTDGSLSRQAVVRKQSLSYDRTRGAFVYSVSIRLLVVDGVWGDDIDTAPVSATATVTLTTTIPAVRHLVVAYTGSAPVRPLLRVALNAGSTWTPSVVWKGVNLVSNPSYEKGVDVPTDWVAVGAPIVHQHGGRTGARFIEVSPANYFTQDIPVNGSQEYTISAYFSAPLPALDGTVYIEWRTDAGTISNTGGEGTAGVASAAWTRLTLTRTAPNNATIARITANGTLGIYTDDIQFEATASASPFASDDHVTLTRSANLVHGSGQRTWTADMARGRVRLLDSANLWTEDSANVNGHYFELLPVSAGKQHVHFGAPTGGTIGVGVYWANRYF